MGEDHKNWGTDDGYDNEDVQESSLKEELSGYVHSKGYAKSNSELYYILDGNDSCKSSQS